VLLGTWPVHTDLDWEACTSRTIVIDLFPFHGPYSFNYLIKRSQMQAVVAFLNKNTRAGSLSRAVGKAGDKLFTHTVKKTTSLFGA
jgi:hypothetical protein